jgi:hypothetical protein
MGNTIPSPRGGRRPIGGAAGPKVFIVASGADAYTINLSDDNKLGGGNYADVYKIQKKGSK